jgi:hypothetical protein
LERFGSIFTFIDNSAHVNDPAAFGGGWNVARIPSALFNYFLLNPQTIKESFPYFQFAPVVYFDDSLFFKYYREYTISLILCSSWLLIPSCMWFAVSVGRLRLRQLILPALFLSQAFAVLPFYFITMPYSVDLLPFFICCFALLCVSFREEVAWQRISLNILLPFFTFASMIVTVSATLNWCAAESNWMIKSTEYKTSLNSLFQLLN